MNGDLKVQLDRYGGYRHGYNTLNAKERKGKERREKKRKEY